MKNRNPVNLVVANITLVFRAIDFPFDLGVSTWLWLQRQKMAQRVCFVPSIAGLHLVFGRRVDGTIPKVVPLTFNPGYIELGTRWGGGRTPARSFNGCPFAARHPATRNGQHETASQIPRVYLETWHALRPRCGGRRCQQQPHQ